MTKKEKMIKLINQSTTVTTKPKKKVRLEADEKNRWIQYQDVQSNIVNSEAPHNP